MKLSKLKLKQIIKEELGEISEAPEDPVSQMRTLYTVWEPETPEGEQYKADLGSLIEALGGTLQEQETLEE